MTCLGAACAGFWGSDWDSSTRILLYLLVNNDEYSTILVNYGKLKFFVWTLCRIGLSCQEGQVQTRVSCRDMNDPVLVSCRAARIISELVGTYIVASWLHLESLDMGIPQNRSSDSETDDRSTDFVGPVDKIA